MTNQNVNLQYNLFEEELSDAELSDEYEGQNRIQFECLHKLDG